MLKYNINGVNLDVSYKQLSVGSVFSDVKTEDIVVISDNHNIINGDIVRFDRNDGRNISFTEEKTATRTNDDVFLVDKFERILLIADTVEDTAIRVHPNDECETWFLHLNLAESSQHIFCENRDDLLIRTSITDDDIASGNTPSKMCVGDYVVYNNNFLYHTNDIVNGFYVFDDEFSNISRKQLKIALTPELSMIISGHDTTEGGLFTWDDEYLYLNDGIVPFIPYPIYIDNRREMLFKRDIDNVLENELCVYLVSNVTRLYWYCDDERFFTIDKSTIVQESEYGYNVILKSNTTISKRVGDIKLKLGLGQIFATDLYKQTLVDESLTEEFKIDGVNKILDYERQIFYPVMIESKNEDDKLIISDDENIIQYQSDGTIESFSNIEQHFKPVDKITFCLNFRERDITKSENTVDYKTWSVKDNGGWNMLVTTANTINSEGDILGWLGFSDDDVRYQKMCLKQSFLRLSFYDTPYRTNQTLQFYSTIFFDTNKLFGIYSKARTLNRSDEYVATSSEVIPPPIDGHRFVFNENKNYQLNAKFETSNKYDDSCCSDGFYLYMFDSLLTGSTFRPLYMKVEFNNAIFGRIVPFIMPVDEEYNPIPFNSDFPKDYEEKIGDDIKINMGRLYQDMYIKVFIKYDNTRKRYIWMFPRLFSSENNREIKLNLYEPRINKVN